MGKRVLLGMSGGVDSSVSAILLKKKGYEVVGVTLDLCKDSDSASNEELKNAVEVLGIEHHIYNCKDIFESKVINNFVEEYSNNKTPNPCIECNKYLKFGFMIEKAKELNCDYVATGHYAKQEYSEKYGRFVLKKSNSTSKDQSYVLWSMPKEIIEHLIFPLENFENKEAIRNIAAKNHLIAANKKDSEDICFIPDGDYKKFLEENSSLVPKEGNIVNEEGKVLGKHCGLYYYTVGQRRGLGIANEVPLFVIGFNKEKNEVIVGEEDKLYKREFDVKDINLLLFDEIRNPIRVDIKTRYSAKFAKGVIWQEEKDKIHVLLDDAGRAITPGQSAVFYIDDIVVGGGKII